MWDTKENSERNTMNWIELNSSEQLDSLKKLSFGKPQIIFKHSTRCSISSMAKSRLDNAEQPAGADFYYLDLIRYRDLSNQIAEGFQVHHESPQVLLIRNGECTYDESHLGIQPDDIREQL